MHRTSQNEEKDNELIIDTITWRQLINNALRRSHGVFGEGIEYSILNTDDKIAFFKVGYNEREMFTIALTTYISSDDLVSTPLVVSIMQQTPNLKELDVSDDDRLWLNRELERDMDNNKCL